jgi:hypothetical protein
MKSLIRLWHYSPAVLLVMVVVISCQKSNVTNSESNKTTATAYITAKPWKYDTSGFDTNNSGTIGQGGDTTVIPMCERDDIFTFKSDSTGTVNTGALHCIVGEPQTKPFTWSLSADGKTFKASINPILQEGVKVLTIDSLHFSVYRDSTKMGVNYRYIVMLKHP